MLSYIGKTKIQFCRKTAKFYAKITRNGKIFEVSIFPVMVPLHSYQFNKNNLPLFILW